MKATAPSTPATHSGTLVEFIRARSIPPANHEQMEAFGREFYLLVACFVYTESEKISLDSAMRFPRIDVNHMDLMTFVLWSFLYIDWTAHLYPCEREALNSAEFTWE